MEGKYMHKLRRTLTALSLCILLSGCAFFNNSLTANTISATSLDNEPLPTPSSFISSIAAAPTEKAPEFTFTIDGNELCLRLGMALSEAEAVLTDAAISYDIMDDTSLVRNRSGYSLRTRSCQLVFDLNEKLHEISFGEGTETNLPVKIGDTITSIQAELGQQEPVDCPEYPVNPASALCCEYAMDGYYLRPIFGGDRMEDEYHVWQIIVSKYSMHQYADTANTTRLTFTNAAGDQAEFYIGMPEEDAKDRLESLGIGYSYSYDLIFGKVVLGQPSTPEDNAFEGYCFYIYFHFDQIQTIDITGSGVYTEEGLYAQDSLSEKVYKERMTELYGNDYFEWPIRYEDYQVYGYISGLNYLFVRVSTFQGDGAAYEAVTGFYITRYSNTRAFD